jgi:hypothetical protein
MVRLLKSNWSSFFLKPIANINKIFSVSWRWFSYNFIIVLLSVKTEELFLQIYIKIALFWDHDSRWNNIYVNTVIFSNLHHFFDSIFLFIFNKDIKKNEFIRATVQFTQRKNTKKRDNILFNQQAKKTSNLCWTMYVEHKIEIILFIHNRTCREKNTRIWHIYMNSKKLKFFPIILSLIIYIL